MKDNLLTAEKLSYKIKWAYTALTMLMVLFSLVLQFTISIIASEDKGHSLAFSLGQLISYFTILANLLIMKSLIIQLVAPQSYWGRFFAKPFAQTGMAVYITVVGLVYWVALRGQWKPQGWFKLADDLLHTVNPIMFIIFWLVFAAKNNLVYKYIFTWLWFPLIYSIYIIIRGAIYNRYPYYFVDVSIMGYGRALIHFAALMLLFMGMGALFVWVGRLIAQPAKTAS
ncbi:Pr6Pr family membrane protein [Mucilaginibacter sp. X4EP1]|uniref:Pr6Pr family membrane protein n=1 Tax=Mucilaginibacter sp. X4EP1 TaxID=2723092 RepID=UPI002169B547|nr:Pr6Pr family membrane protein [Mucilaginibacter sp. X4EP1]MCS3815632.1 hypothetical protein [Mucilaginibacter sp. X4EP1]